MKLHNCPRCSAQFEKVDGCSHMTCPVCKYNWCWICGLAKDSWFHKMQIIHEMETGILCVWINNFTYNYGNEFDSVNYCLKIPVPIKIIMTIVLITIVPGIAACLCVLIAPFVCVIMVTGNRIWYKFRRWIFLLPIYIIIWTLIYSLAVATSIVVSCLLFILFYLVCVILIFRIAYMFLCKSRRVNKKNKLLATSGAVNRNYKNDQIL